MGGANDKNFTAIFGGVFGGVGLLLLVGAFVAYFSTKNSQQGTLPIKGKVIRLSASRGSKGGTSYTPVVEFEVNKQVYQIYGSVSSNPPAFEIGEEVSLFVNPQSPETASIDSFMENWFVVLILSFMGAVFTTIGGRVLRTAWRKKEEQTQ